MIRFCGKIKNQIQVKILDLYSKQAVIMLTLGLVIPLLGILLFCWITKDFQEKLTSNLLLAAIGLVGIVAIFIS